MFRYELEGRKVARIKVSDTGQGILEELLPYIFEPYHTSRHDSTHFGLGLSYCRKVVFAHQGYIDVKSRTGPPDSGTTFTICLPLAARKRGRRIWKRT